MNELFCFDSGVRVELCLICWFKIWSICFVTEGLIKLIAAMKENYTPNAKGVCLYLHYSSNLLHRVCLFNLSLKSALNSDEFVAFYPHVLFLLYWNRSQLISWTWKLSGFYAKHDFIHSPTSLSIYLSLGFPG